MDCDIGNYLRFVHFYSWLYVMVFRSCSCSDRSWLAPWPWRWTLNNRDLICSTRVLRIGQDGWNLCMWKQIEIKDNWNSKLSHRQQIVIRIVQFAIDRSCFRWSNWSTDNNGRCYLCTIFISLQWMRRTPIFSNMRHRCLSTGNLMFACKVYRAWVYAHDYLGNRIFYTCKATAV